MLDLNCRIEELQSKETGLVSEQQRLAEDLAEAHERLVAETNAHQGSVERVEAASRELEMLKVELNAARQNIEKAQFDKARVCTRHGPHPLAPSKGEGPPRTPR